MIKDYENFLPPAQDLDEGRAFYEDKPGLRVKFDFADKGMIAFGIGE